MVSAPFTVIDVGPSQGLPDWVRVAACGRTAPGVRIDAAYLKATEGAAGAGSSVPEFPRNAAGVVASGLGLGCYHFLSALSEPQAQADHFLAVIDGCGHTLPPMIDVERGVGASGKCPTVECLLAFLEAVEDALDVVPLIYTAGWVAGPMGLARHPELTRCPLWVPAYQLSDPPLCPPWGSWEDDPNVVAWQFTSQARVPGINLGVDMSRFKAMPAWTLARTDPPPATQPSGS